MRILRIKNNITDNAEMWLPSNMLIFLRTVDKQNKKLTESFLLFWALDANFKKSCYQLIK